MSMNTRASSSARSKQPSDNHLSEAEDQRSSSPDLKVQLRTLQDAQAKQALDVAETKATMATIQKLLLQLTSTAVAAPTTTEQIRETVERSSASPSAAPPNDSPTTEHDRDTPETISSR
jgi:hypothetical protein